MKLRDYQEEAIDHVLKSLKKTKKAFLVLPTGSGKTFTITSLLKLLNKKTLVISHTREIVAQTQKSLDKHLAPHPHLSISIQKAERNIFSLHKENFECLVIDECHRGAAKSYLKVIDGLQLKKTHLIGITATPFRSDKKALTNIFGPISYQLNIVNLIERGFLVDFVGFRAKTNVNLSGISTKDGDFIASKLSAVINVKNRNSLIVREFISRCSFKPTIAFCADLQHCKDLRDEFLSNEIPAEVISGKVSVRERKRILDDFACGIVTVLINCNVLTEGFDEPSIECILMCRPTMSKGLYIQMIGRGSRKCENKKNCIVMEFTDNAYDVCSLEVLLEKSSKKVKPIEGESLLSFSKRVKKHLSEVGEDIIVEEYKFVHKNIHERPPTPWQLKILEKIGYPRGVSLTEFTADKYIRENYGDH